MYLINQDSQGDVLRVGFLWKKGFLYLLVLAPVWGEEYNFLTLWDILHVAATRQGTILTPFLKLTEQKDYNLVDRNA